MKNKGGPTKDEDAKQDGQCDGPFHVGSGKCGDLPGMGPGQQEHVHIEAEDKDQHQREQRCKGDHCGDAVGEDHHGDATAGAAGPDDRQDSGGPAHGHNAVVLQSMEDGDVAVSGNHRQAGNGAQEGEDEQGVDDVVGCGFKIATRLEITHVSEHDQDIFQDLIQAAQHVGNGQAANEKVHGCLEILILDHSQQDDQILQHPGDGYCKKDLFWQNHMRTV